MYDCGHFEKDLSFIHILQESVTVFLCYVKEVQRMVLVTDDLIPTKTQ